MTAIDTKKTSRGALATALLAVAALLVSLTHGCGVGSDTPSRKEGGLATERAAVTDCSLIPADYIDANDGCDCPADGSTSCDPDCLDANRGGDFCGCEYCYGDPPAPPAAYAPPAENAAFGISGTPPSMPQNALVTAQAVGRMPGAGTVTKDGSYAYSLPISLPPGRADMTPGVALVYDSRGGDGLLGIGWALSAGQSMISRCSKQFASGYRALATDARVRQTENLQFTTSDPLCLDGQKLEVVAGTNGRASSEYRTEVANFAKIVGEGGCATCEPDRFKVYFKNGSIGTYTKHGGTNAAGTALTGMYREGGAIVTLLWAQTRLEDRSGNAIEYVWAGGGSTTATGTQTMPQLTDINYTTCSTAGGNTCPYGTAGLRKIKFNYAARTDTRKSYLNGIRLDSTNRLASVVVYGNAGTSAVNWTYTLGYKQSAFTNRTLLESVQQCAGTDCLPKTSFSWQDAGKNTWAVRGMTNRSWNLVNPGQTDSLGTEPNASEVTFVTFDADGDGQQDLILKEWPATAIDANTGQLLRTSNTMGVGPVDYLLMSDRAGYFKPEQAIDLEGDGTPQASVRCGSAPTATQLQGEIADLSATVVIDLDMDGRDELLAPINTGCPFQWVSTAGSVSTGVRMIPGLKLAPRNVNTTGQRVYKVLNYDRTTLTLKARATPVPFFNSGFWDTWKYSFADLTGDGLPEVMFGASGRLDDVVNIAKAYPTGAGEEDAVNPEIQYISMNGTPAGYDTRLRYSWQPEASTVRTPNVIRVLDENGDGRTEIMQLSYDGGQRGFSVNALQTQAIRSYTKGAESWVQPQNLDGSGGTPAHEWPAYPTAGSFTSDVMSWRYIDVNGDGLKDAFYSRKNTTTNKYEWFFRINNGQPKYLAETAVGHVDILTAYGSQQQIQVNGALVKVPQDSGLRFADMNGDGREDLVLLDSTNGSIMYSNGAGFDAPIDLPARHTSAVVRLSHPSNVTRWPSTQLVDIDGDGLTDLVEFVRDPANSKKRLLLTMRRVLPNGHDVITAVTDGLHTLPAESVSYNTLGDQTFHASDNIPKYAANGTTRTSPLCRYPARCISKGLAVARYQNFRSSRKIDTQYTYAGARFDVTGRGGLGFRQVKALDNVTGIENLLTFEQGAFGLIQFDAFHLYPYLDTPKSVVTLQTTTWADLSLSFPDGKRTRTTTTWNPTFAVGLPLRVTRSRSETVVADMDSILTTTPTSVDRNRHRTDVQYDEYGSAVSSSETTEDLGTADANATMPNVTSARTSTLTYFPADTSTWILSRPSSISVTATTDDPECAQLSNCSSVIQQTWFEYETAARKMLRKITREPALGASQKLITTIERDAAGLVRRTRLKDSAGKERVSQIDYDANGVFPKASRNAVGHVSYLSYNTQLGLLDRQVDPNGVWVSNTYDKLGRFRRTDGSDGSFTAVSFGKQPWSTSEVLHTITTTTSTGADSKTFFDARGNAIMALTPGFNATAGGAPSSTTLLLTGYDALGNAAGSQFYKHTAAYATALTSSFDSLLSALLGNSEMLNTARYDIYGRPSDSVLGDSAKAAGVEGAGEHQRYFYPRLGETRVVDASNHEFRNITDARGNTRRVYQGKSNDAASFVSIDYGFSALGKLASVRPKNSPAERFIHDVLGRPTTWLMGGTLNARTWTYTAFDQIDRATEGNELSIKFEYDALGRPLSRTEESHATAAERSIRYEWDRSPKRDAACAQITGGGFTLGQLSFAEVEGGHRSGYGYDPQGRACSVREGFQDDLALWVGYAYDSVGRMNVIKYPGTQRDPEGLQIKYEFATNGQLRRVVDLTPNPDVELWRVTQRHPIGMVTQAVNGAGLTSKWLFQTNTLRLKQQEPMAGASQAFAFHENGLLKSRTFNGTAYLESYGYNSVGHRLTDYTRAAPATTVKLDADYAYNVAGDILTLKTNTAASPDLGPVGTQVFGYGAGDPLGGGNGANYSDLLTTIDPSTLGASGTISYGYDSAGRQTSKFVGGVSKRSISDYNTFNLPTEIDLEDGATRISLTWLAYDAHGNRTSKRTHTVATDSDETVRYIGKLFEAQDFLNRRTTPATAVQRSLFRVYAESRPIAEISHNWDGSVQTQFLSTDDQGSVNYRTEGAVSVGADGSGGPAGFRGFNPYGKRWSDGTSATMFSSIGFTGHVHDDDLGLINMNGRLYDTEQQRFISRDPLMMPFVLGGTNAYGYVLGNPTNLNDPSGFQACAADETWDPVEGCVGELTVISDRSPDYCAAHPGDLGCSDFDICMIDPGIPGCGGPNDGVDGDGCFEGVCPVVEPRQGRIPPPPTEPPPGPPPGPPGSYACETWKRCRTATAEERGLPILTGPTGLYFGDDVAYTPASTTPASNSGKDSKPPQSTGGNEVIEALAWLGGWEGTQQFVSNGGVNYGAAGQFMARLDDSLNATLFSLTVSSGLSSLMQPAHPAAAGESAAMSAMATTRAAVAPEAMRAGGALSTAEVAGLKVLLGISDDGAYVLISRLNAGESVALPSNVTPTTLQNYLTVAERAIAAGKDTQGVQAARKDAIELLLKKLGQ